ncbi:MAG: tRNA lysidine(34) synthetase TilS [bacterium]
MNGRIKYHLVQRIRKFSEKHALLKQSDSVLIGISGGPDSVALLYLLLELREEYSLRLALAHLEHGIRGEESREQARFVQHLGKELGLECFVRHVDVPRLSRTRGLSLEEAAREARYRFFRETGRDIGATRIALGHTADDQAETLLMRLFRGAGLDGLAAMRPRRDEEIPLIRPLLDVFRREILDFLDEQKLPFCLDSTNRELNCLRNRIRLHLIPLLSREYNPQILVTLHQTASILGEEQEWISRLVKEHLGQCLEEAGEQRMRFALDPFLAAPLALQRETLREAVQQAGSSPYKTGFLKVSAVLQWLKEGRAEGVMHLGRDLRIRRHGKSFWIEGRQEQFETLPQADFCHQMNIPGNTLIPELNLSISAEILPAGAVPAEAISPEVTEVMDSGRHGSQCKAEKACLDFDTLPLPLVIRKRQAGDRFHPLGGPGHKKLKNFFIDAKIPRPEREKIPVVAFGQEVVWVFGRRIAEPFKITEKTERVLRLATE